VVRQARTAPVDPRVIDRAHKMAVGATDGNIIAAIMVTHIARNRGSCVFIVPAAMPIPLACRTVTTQARTASSNSAVHGTTTDRSGRLRIPNI
jgi:hypothetical protein